MRRHAKASPAGSTNRPAAAPSDPIRGAAGRRGAVGACSGSGAPASRGRVAFLALAAAAALLLLAFVPLAHSKTVVDGYGTTENGSAGGSFGLNARFCCGRAEGIAVNGTGAGGVSAGTVYAIHNIGVASRVQRFSPSGAFERTWGWNVFGYNEIQTFQILNAGELEDSDGGSFTLTFNGDTTSPIAVSRVSCCTFHPTAEEVETALVGLPSIAPGDVRVTSEGFTGREPRIEFRGAYGGTDVPQLTADSSGLIAENPLGNPSISVSTIETGAGGPGEGFEICTVAALCSHSNAWFGEPQRSTANGGDMHASDLTVSQSTGDVYVMDEGFNNEGPSNRRVEQFDADGNFIRTWGWDVIASGAPNDTGTGFEICDTTAATPNVSTDCQNGVPGANGGQFGASGSLGSAGRIVTDSSGNVWVADATNRRIQEFDASGNFIAAYGFNVNGGGVLEKCTSTAAGVCQAGTQGSALGQFNERSPTSIAFDSSGNLYATDRGNNRVQKFNSTLTSVEEFAGSTFADYTTQAPMQVIPAQGGNRLLFVVRNTVFGENEGNILELDPTDGSLEDVSLLNAGIDTFGEEVLDGIAEDAASGDVFALTMHEAAPRPILRLSSTPLPDVAVTADPVTTKTDTTATISGTVDPNGGWVQCKVEYSEDEQIWDSVTVPDCSSLANGGGAQPVSVGLTGLEPNTQYFVRLRASRPLVPGSTKQVDFQFNTASVVPAISNIGAVDIADTSARLVASIDPRKSLTSYVFEYGTTPALGSATSSVGVGAGNAPVTVSQVVSGLTPATTYYFQVVATNGAGPATSPLETFTTRVDAVPLPDNRAYEQVSPPDKNGGGALSGSGAFSGGPATVAENGEAVQFLTSSIFGDPPSVQAFAADAPYVSRRGPDGWQTESPVRHMCRLDLDDKVGIPFVLMSSLYSPMLDQLAYTWPESASCSIPPADPNAPLPAANLYLAKLLSDPTQYTLLAPEPSLVIPTFLTKTGSPTGNSADFTHIVYDSNGQQTPDAPPAEPENDRPSVFEWDNGTLRLVSRDPDGNVFTDGSVSADGCCRVSGGYGGVSADGRRIYFYNPAIGIEEVCNTNPCDLYMREDGTTTYEVSESECTSSCGPDLANEFAWGSVDGSKTLINSKEKLTDDDKIGRDLFFYNHGPDPENEDNLTLVSLDQEPADGPGADFQQVVGVSDDLETVFYIGKGQVVPGAPTSAGGKLYRWRWNGGSPETDYLAPVPSALFFGSGAVTPDGQYVVFRTDQQLEPVADQDADADIFRWSEADGWLCISCQTPGGPSAGDAGWAEGASAQNHHNLRVTDDGMRIFFTTPDAFSPNDVNDDVRDVYEWHDGTVSMISTGTDKSNVRLLGFSSTGSDVFFYTEVKLVGWDSDRIGDIYDARVDGGFPEPPPAGGLCEGEACRGAGSVPPDTNGAGSAVFEGPKNSAKIKSCPRGIRKVTTGRKEFCKKRKTRKHRKAKNRHRRRPTNANRGARK